MKGYLTRSNQEGGKGRSDLFIQPVTWRKPAYVLKFKVVGKFADLQKKAEEALKQIEDRRYVQELQNDGYETVYQYGIAFLERIVCEAFLNKRWYEKVEREGKYEFKQRKC